MKGNLILRYFISLVNIKRSSAIVWYCIATTSSCPLSVQTLHHAFNTTDIAVRATTATARGSACRWGGRAAWTSARGRGGRWRWRGRDSTRLRQHALKGRPDGRTGRGREQGVGQGRVGVDGWCAVMKWRGSASIGRKTVLFHSFYHWQRRVEGIKIWIG